MGDFCFWGEVGGEVDEFPLQKTENCLVITTCKGFFYAMASHGVAYLS